MQGREDVVSWLQRVSGYTMTGSVAEKILVLNWGEGDNGKTILINLMLRLFGDYAVVTGFGTLTARRDPNAASAMI